ncbi:toprim domain-containing protein [Garciella nitratireducens]|uniref:toprim domain-containing protein n=1 Tax=Garciella nitratireducens TaxID=218205 RepID=UPI001BD1F944|nr:toprim domain-containing protein [Garciella nitratireducens]
MGNKTFTFGKVKGMDMVKVMNMETIHASFTGLQYLWGQYKRSTNDAVKEEIAECFKTYAGDYIVRFGKYKGLTLKQINELNRSYLENYLTHNDNEEIRVVVKTYLKYHPEKMNGEYNNYQQQTYAYYNELKQKINDSSQSNIEYVIRTVGYAIENGKFEHCPWGCDMHSKRYQHAILKKGKDDSYFVGCFKCGKRENFIKFVCEKKNYSFTEALEWITGVLGITVSNIQKTNVAEIKKEFVNAEEEIVLEKRILPEISLEGFGFNKGVYPPAFFKRGFTVKDAEEMEVYFAGRDCTNGFKNRICFLVRDLEGRLVGVVGRSKYSEEEHYDYWAKRLELHKTMSREEQIREIENQNCIYKKYYNFEGFKSGCTLYNANRLVNSSKEEVFIVEGPFDVMKMVLKHGYKNTVGMFGHSFSKGQLYQLYQLYENVREKIKIYLLVDNDEAGLKGFENNVKSLQELGFRNIYKMVLEGVKDAGEATKEQVDKAYKTAQLQTIRYNKKKIVVKDYDTGLKSIVE